MGRSDMSFFKAHEFNFVKLVVTAERSAERECRKQVLKKKDWIRKSKVLIITLARTIAM